MGPTIPAFAARPTSSYVNIMATYRDLSGIWTGSFKYSIVHMRGVTFTAWIDDTNGVLGGTILEPNTFANSTADELSATLSGTRTGLDVAFSKQYDPGQGTHGFTIRYLGKVNSDFTVMMGRWQISGDFGASGNFELSRQSGAFEAIERAREVVLTP